jgi:hypothetical protein
MQGFFSRQAPLDGSISKTTAASERLFASLPPFNFPGTLVTREADVRQLTVFAVFPR